MYLVLLIQGAPLIDVFAQCACTYSIYLIGADSGMLVKKKRRKKKRKRRRKKRERKKKRRKKRRKRRMHSCNPATPSPLPP